MANREKVPPIWSLKEPSLRAAGSDRLRLFALEATADLGRAIARAEFVKAPRSFSALLRRCAAAARAALAGAAPLTKNAYKLPIFETLVRRAILSLAGAWFRSALFFILRFADGFGDATVLASPVLTLRAH